MSPDGTEKPYGKSPGIKIHLKKKKSKGYNNQNNRLCGCSCNSIRDSEKADEEAQMSAGGGPLGCMETA